MEISANLEESQRLVRVDRRDNGVLITFGDGLTILYSARLLRFYAFSHPANEAPPSGPS